MDQSESCTYGIHAVEELLSQRMSSVDHIYFDKDKRNPALFNLIKLCRKERLSYNLVPAGRLDALAGSSKHQGVIAFCSLKPYTTPEELKKILREKTAPALLVLAASVEDPGNLGSIIRSSVAFGADALLLERKNTAPLNASVAKSSAGSIEHINIVRPKNLEGLVKEFVSEGYSVVTAEMKGGRHPEKVDLRKPLLLVVGGEHRAIPPYLAKIGTDSVSIPISSKAQSLNAAVACAVLLYECARQRHSAGLGDTAESVI